jgi:hypothetical protein
MNTIDKRQDKNKELLIEQLKTRPIVQIACEKSGISRATYYRWRKEDGKFLKKSDEAIQEGSLLVNDMAESQLMSAIRDKNLTAIIFWLKHHHPAYVDKIEIKGKLKHQYNLSSEQEALISKALLMVIGKEKNGQ